MTMSLVPDNVPDYESIMSVYHTIVDGEDANWLLLQYGDNDAIYLFAHGSDGLTGIKSSILSDTEQVYFAFYREEIKVRPGFAVINYIPLGVSGVQRASALVQSRRITAGFTRENHALLTVDHLSNLTPTAIHQAVLNPESTHNIQMERGASPSPTPSDKRSPRAIRLEPVRRSFTEMYAPDKLPLHMQKAGSLFSLLRRKPRKEAVAEEELPAPPTPPKDTTRRATQTLVTASRSLPQPIPRRRSVSEYAMISHHSLTSFEDEVIVDHPSPPKFSPPVIIPLDGKWTANASTTIVSDPAERARRRQIAREQKELEEQQAIEEEQRRQYEIRLRKDEMRRQEMEDDANRRVSLEQEIRRNTEARRRKEQMEREQEERKRKELEQRKSAARERRLEEHKRLEEWRVEQAHKAQEALKKEEALKRHEANERKKRIAQVEAKVKNNSKSEDLVTGWMTMQTSDNIVWRRRYYRFIGSTLFLYRSPKDIHQVLDDIDLHGKVAGLKEWNEGYEDLKAIPHSFAIEFKDDRGPWSMFCDQEEEKIKLLGLLTYSAGL